MVRLKKFVQVLVTPRRHAAAISQEVGSRTRVEQLSAMYQILNSVFGGAQSAGLDRDGQAEQEAREEDALRGEGRPMAGGNSHPDRCICCASGQRTTARPATELFPVS